LVLPRARITTRNHGRVPPRRKKKRGTRIRCADPNQVQEAEDRNKRRKAILQEKIEDMLLPKRLKKSHRDIGTNTFMRERDAKTEKG
jgi:hypothetical protein